MTTTQQLSPQLATIIALLDVMRPLEDETGYHRHAEYIILSKALVQLLGMEADRAKVELLTR